MYLICVLHNKSLKIFFVESNHRNGWLYVVSGCSYVQFFCVKILFFVIKIGVERLKVLSFVTSKFIYPVLTFAILLIFNLRVGEVFPLNQSEVDVQSSRVTLYSPVS